MPLSALRSSAARNELLRIPGLGPTTVDRILDHAALDALLARVASTDRHLGPHAAATVEASRLPEAGPAEPARPTAPGAPLIDEAALLDRFGGDTSFMRQLLGIFVEEAQGRRDAYAAAVRDVSR